MSPRASADAAMTATATQNTKRKVRAVEGTSGCRSNRAETRMPGAAVCAGRGNYFKINTAPSRLSEKNSTFRLSRGLLALVQVRRGRPHKFSRPARTVTVTLPDDVIEALGQIDADLSRAIVRLAMPLGNRPQAPVAEVAAFVVV